MPSRPRPRYEPNRNQWTLKYKSRRRYLCSGPENEALAWAKASIIMDLPDELSEVPRTVTDGIVAWLQLNGGVWERDILAPFARWSVGTLLDEVHSQYLEDFKLHVEKLTYVRDLRPKKTRNAEANKQKTKPKPTPKHYAPSVIRRQIRYAHTVLRWCHVRGYMKAPIPEMPRKLPRVAEVDRSLTPEQLQLIFAGVSSRARDILLFVACTGCRPTEAALLQHSEVDIDGDRCVLQRGKTHKATGKARVIYLTAGAKAVLERQPTESGYVFLNRYKRPYKQSGLRTIFKVAAKKAGIDVPGAYCLRHSFAQHAIDHYVSEGDVGKALGHQAGSTATRVYARIRDERALKAVQSLGAPISADPIRATTASKVGESSASQRTGRAKKRKSATDRRRRTG